jgi:hypothetical protein
MLSVLAVPRTRRSRRAVSPSSKRASHVPLHPTCRDMAELATDYSEEDMPWHRRYRAPSLKLSGVTLGMPIITGPERARCGSTR